MVRAMVVCAVVGGAGCPESSGDVAAVALAGTEGRGRYIVTMDVPAVDLSGYRALQKDNPEAVAGWVARKREDLAAAQAELDGVVRGVGGRVVGRWWMTGQATIEVSPAGIASVRATKGVKLIEPDQPLQ